MKSFTAPHFVLFAVLASVQVLPRVSAANGRSSIAIDRTGNIADTARQAKNGKAHVVLSGLGISPPGHLDEIDLVVASAFSAGCRVTSPDGSSQPCDTGRVVLTSSFEEPTFTVLSTDEATGETTGYSMAGGKKFFTVKQKKNQNVDVEDATDAEFVQPAWTCDNDSAGLAAQDEGERRRLLGHSHSHHEHEHE